MKIVGVETIVVNMPMIIDGPVVPRMAGAPRTSMDTLLVRVDTDEGVTGWGEGFGHRIFSATKAVIDTIVGPMCVGRDPTAINALVGDLQRNLVGAGRNGPAMFALSAIDIALWDIAGKIAGLPLYRLLGGSLRRELPAYASLLRYADPAAVEMAVERSLGRGYRHIKVHEITEAPIRAARAAAGPDVPLMVDCTRAWDVEGAIRMARRLADLDLVWIEEPIYPPEDHGGLARIRREGGVPTAAGENAMLADFRAMFEAGSLTYAQPSVAKVGGVSQMLKVNALAEQFGVTVVPHSAYFGPGFLASVHCVAAMPAETLVERYDADFDENPFGDAINPNSRGCITVPQGPGLGVDPDPAVLERLRVR